MTPEQIELTRLNAARIISNAQAGRKVDVWALGWALQFVSQNPPLGRPLGSGDLDLDEINAALQIGAEE